MLLNNRSLKAVTALVLFSAGWRPASAQHIPEFGKLGTPPDQTVDNHLDKETVMAHRGTLMNEKEPKLTQQVWRIAKGKDYDKLPPEFQWDTAPTAVDAPFPVYPYEQLKTKVAGKVRAYFVIGPAGRVVRADLDEAATPEFGQAVRAMLDRLRFQPARKKDGTPALAYVGVEYEFAPKGHSDVPVGSEARFILSDLEKKPANIFNLPDLDHPLKPLARAAPVYPLALQKQMPAGEAEVEFFVDTNGHVQLPHIKSSSAPEFGYAAVQAVAAWKFEPPTKGGTSVVVRAVVPIGFEGRKADAAK